MKYNVKGQFCITAILKSGADGFLILPEDSDSSDSYKAITLPARLNTQSYNYSSQIIVTSKVPPIFDRLQNQ